MASFGFHADATGGTLTRQWLERGPRKRVKSKIPPTLPTNASTTMSNSSTFQSSRSTSSSSVFVPQQSQGQPHPLDRLQYGGMSNGSNVPQLRTAESATIPSLSDRIKQWTTQHGSSTVMNNNNSYNTTETVQETHAPVENAVETSSLEPPRHIDNMRYGDNEMKSVIDGMAESRHLSSQVDEKVNKLQQGLESKFATIDGSLIALRNDLLALNHSHRRPAMDINQEKLHTYVSDACLAVTRRQDDSIQNLTMNVSQLKEQLLNIEIRLSAQQDQTDNQTSTEANEIRESIEVCENRLDVLNVGRFRFYAETLQKVPLFDSPQEHWDEENITSETSIDEHTTVLLEHPMQKVGDLIWIRCHMIDDRGDISVSWIPVFGQNGQNAAETAYLGNFKL